MFNYVALPIIPTSHKHFTHLINNNTFDLTVQLRPFLFCKLEALSLLCAVKFTVTCVLVTEKYGYLRGVEHDVHEFLTSLFQAISSEGELV